MMHKSILDINVASVLRRIEQGDCPAEPALSQEMLENTVADLARALSASANVERETVPYPAAERAFHVVVRGRGEPTEQFLASDRATLSAFPAPDRDHAYWMADSLNNVVAFHVAAAIRALAPAQTKDTPA